MPADRIHGLNTAYWTLDHSLAVQATRIGEPLRATVPCFLIEHPEGLVLFDTGVNHGMIEDPTGYGAPHMEGFVEGIEPQGSVDEQLEGLGVSPEEVDTVILSHLHVDHAGGIDAFPEATFVARTEELRYAWWPESSQWLFYLQEDFASLRSPEFEVREVTGEYDHFGDGSVVAFPTPGHTPGHQSLRVELEGETVILASDVASTQTGFDEELPASFAWSMSESVASMRTVRRMAEQGADVVVNHDPELVEARIDSS
ncbi:N-acyl homoserine lactonase family protein [Natronorarus salvus]|uniref:N-acyl homoserine lactonase family protein n=1 Tax=Natronorarus salvus TaxID=3117733 RepID=UPI002F261C7B